MLVLFSRSDFLVRFFFIFYFQAFDENANGILDGAELTHWREATEQMLTEWNWHPSDEFIAGAHQAWTDSQMDGDEYTGFQGELATFTLRIWNLLLEH